jgi:hypothetical protein
MASGRLNLLTIDLAKVGQDLYEDLLGPFQDPNRHLGQLLAGFRNLLQTQSLHIRIKTREIFIPWDLLYIPDRGFLGDVCCVQTSVASRFSSLPRDLQPRLFNFGVLPFLVSKQIQDVVAPTQRPLKSKLASYRDSDVTVVRREKAMDFQQSVEGASKDQLIYFAFVHSVHTSNGRRIPRFKLGSESFDASELRRWMANGSLPYRPLMILNLCDDNDPRRMNLKFVDHYHDYLEELFASGLSGVIGPEVPVSQPAAAKFAASFVENLLSGRSSTASQIHTVSDVLWATKSEFVKNGDLYALLYSYYLVREVQFPHMLAPGISVNSVGSVYQGDISIGEQVR